MDSLFQLLFVCIPSHDCMAKCWEQTMQLDSLISGFEIFVPAATSRCQFFPSQAEILIIGRCQLKYYLHSCNSPLLFNYGYITSSVSTHELLQLRPKRFQSRVQRSLKQSLLSSVDACPIWQSDSGGVVQLRPRQAESSHLCLKSAAAVTALW